MTFDLEQAKRYLSELDPEFLFVHHSYYKSAIAEIERLRAIIVKEKGWIPEGFD